MSSVNSFLESINDYLKLKDEELALSISAQRLDGYEVEGINEEIDKVTLSAAVYVGAVVGHDASLQKGHGFKSPEGQRVFSWKFVCSSFESPEIPIMGKGDFSVLN